MRVTTARIFYKGREHSKIYYNGEWISSLGEHIEDREIISNVYYTTDENQKNTYSCGQLRNGYSGHDYSYTCGNFYEPDKYQMVHRWRDDQPYIWFRYQGACTIYVRGNGMLKFNNGKRVFVHVKAIRVKDGNDRDSFATVMNNVTAVACPADATECIFIGQLLEGGAYSSWVPDLGSDTTYDYSMYAKWVYTLGFKDSTVQEIQHCGNEGVLPHGKYDYKLDFRPLTPWTMAGIQCMIAKEKVYKYDPLDYKRYHYEGGGSCRVFTVTNAYNYWQTFMNTPIAEIPMQYFKARTDIYEDVASYIWQTDRLFSKMWPHFYAYSVEKCFAECKNLKVVPKDFFSTVKPCHAFRCFYNCTGLTTIEKGALDWFVETDGTNNDEMYSETKFCSWSFARLVEAFKGCTGLRGTVDAIWEKIVVYNAAEIVNGWLDPGNDNIGYYHISNGCFEGCTGLSNYADIPDWWKLPRGTKVYYKYK